MCVFVFLTDTFHFNEFVVSSVDFVMVVALLILLGVWLLI